VNNEKTQSQVRPPEPYKHPGRADAIGREEIEVFADGDGVVLEIARGDREQAFGRIDRFLGHGRALCWKTPFDLHDVGSLGMIAMTHRVFNWHDRLRGTGDHEILIESLTARANFV
jgi:hypothetical protein